MRYAAGEFEQIEYATPDGSRVLTPDGGAFTAETPEDERVLAGFGLSPITEKKSRRQPEPDQAAAPIEGSEA